MAYSVKQRLLLGFVPFSASWVLRSLASSWRVLEAGCLDHSIRVPQRAPLIYAFWHDQIVGVVGHFRGERVHPFASRSFDGELISRALDQLGFPETARGSSSRGGAPALVGLRDYLKRGDHVVFTVDGPRGPRHEVQHGALKLAQLSGAKVVPLAFAAASGFRMRSWDRMLVPAPFTRAAVHFGEALRVPREARSLDSYAAELKRRLDSCASESEASLR